jgi:hypothetical protein
MEQDVPMPKTKILLIGFQRGGTTLFRNIFQNHPDVQKMFHETRILRNLDKQLKKHKVDKNKCFGEKIPWASESGNVVINYGTNWLKTFGNDARIIQIVRHPVDSGLSNQRLKETNEKKCWLSLDVAIKYASKSIPKVINHFRNDYRYTAIAFENLVLDPCFELIRLFNFCNIDTNKDVVNSICLNNEYRYYKNISKDKAYTYKKIKNLKCEIPDYNKILNMIKEIE